MSALPDLSVLGNYPVFQAIVGVTAAIIIYLTWARAQKNPTPPPAQANDAGAAELRWALSGHFTVALELLRDVQENTKSQAEMLRAILSHRERESDVLRRIETSCGRALEEARTSRRLMEEIKAAIASLPSVRRHR